MAKTRPLAECKMCRAERLLCESHIIQDSAYLYSPTQPRLLSISAPTGAESHPNSGLKEYLLCDDCEQLIGRLENPFKAYWDHPTRFPAVLDMPLLRLSGVDFQLTTKLLLSVLYRAHAARSSTLELVDLGPYAEVIRELLLDEESQVPADRFPIKGTVLRELKSRQIARWLVLSPARGKVEGAWCYTIAMFGCAWDVFVSRTVPRQVDEIRLKPDGTAFFGVIDYIKHPAIYLATKAWRSARGLS